ncbi:MAG: pantoate--beta-alanine ligase [bacterium]
MIHSATITGVKEYLSSSRKQKKSIGFVPTMGALHNGHLEVIRRSKKENDLTVCSIFVNPIQFTNANDLKQYPRMPEQDAKLLLSEGVDLLFAPTADEIYPPGEEPLLTLDFGKLDRVMEGRYRPGHFNGVAIVAKKLFEIVEPTRAYFGKKDFQQLAIIRHMVQTLGIPVEIVPCDTVREPDGLAMSSRNLRLTIGERKVASRIYDVLMFTKANAGTVPVKRLQVLAMKRLHEVPVFRPEYFEIVDAVTLLPIHSWKDTEQAVACTAVHVGDVRLIDNMELFS